MKSKEIKLLIEFLGLLESIPAGQTGAGGSSISLPGVIAAHNDFVQARVATRLFLTKLVERGHQDHDAASVLAVFRDWLAQRRAMNWESPTADFWHFYWKER